MQNIGRSIRLFMAGATLLAAIEVAEAAALPDGCGESDQTISCFATPSGGPGFNGSAKIEKTGALQAILTKLATVTDRKIEIQLLTVGDGNTPTSYRNKADGVQRPFTISRLATSKDQSLTIRGIRSNGAWLTWFEGKTFEEEFGSPSDLVFLSNNLLADSPAALAPPTARARAEQYDDFLSDSGAEMSVMDTFAVEKRKKGDPICLKITDSAYVRVAEVGFRDCWIAGISAKNLSHFKVLDSKFERVGRAIYVTAKGSPKNSAHIEVAGNTLDADPSGEIWTTIPWGVTHDGELAAFNGALLASKNIAGPVSFHGNTVTNAYNGIRLVARLDEQECDEKCFAQVNESVQVYDNHFDHVRDNPVEAEGRARMWAVYNNEFENSHGWISLDGAQTGPIYVWGNVGWFNDLPAQSCKDNGKWAIGWFFDIGKTERWLRIDPTYEYDPLCWTHQDGTVFKLGPVFPDNPLAKLPMLYAFNNSWYLRSPIFRGGLVQGLRHWNNAIYFAGCGTTGDVNCRIYSAGPTVPYGIYPTPDGQSLFYSYFSIVDPASFDPKQGKYTVALDYAASFNLSNYGFPAIKNMDESGKGSLKGDALFTAAHEGNFHTAENSPARMAACTVEIDGNDDSKLKCSKKPQAQSPDIGAVQSKPAYGNPLYQLPIKLPIDVVLAW